MAVIKKVMARKVCAAAVMAACASSAFAIELDMPEGWRGSINTTLSVSSSWRAEDPDKNLLNAANARANGWSSASTNAAAAAQGYTAGATDDFNQNYGKGDQYSELYKVLSEFTFTNGTQGGLVRVKGWYDDSLSNDDVIGGNQSSGYAQNKPLSDRYMSSLNKFNGLELLDAYVYTSFDVADMPMQVRAGRLAMNWGESLFIKGVNDNARLDISALRKPGTELKEALLPTYAMTANIGLPGGISLDGFYQFKHDPYNIDECGTLWSPVNGTFNTNSNACAAAQIVGGNRAGYANGFYLTAVSAPGSKEDIDGGEYGLSLKFPIESIDTEIGLYAMNTHSKVPMLNINVGSDLRGYLSAVAFASPALPDLTKAQIAALGVPMTAFENTDKAFISRGGLPAVIGGLVSAGYASGAVTNTTGYWFYPEDIQTYGISAATTIAGWSMAAELSYQHNVPVLRNGADLIAGALNGVGPLASGQVGTVGVTSNGNGLLSTGTSLANQTPKTGTVEGWTRVNKTQFQLNGLVTLPSIPEIGAVSGLFVAEAGFQWADLPNDGSRYGRGFIFNLGTDSTYQQSGAASVGCENVGVVPAVQNTGCKDAGYATDYSWGYRMRVSLDFPQVFGTSWQITPSVFVGHDVDGYSIDGQFNEGRLAVNYGLEFNLNKVHKVNFNYATFSDGADYDQFRNNDNYSLAYSYTF